MMQAKQPGGIMLIVLYLSGTWMFDLMPCSYYSFDGGVRPHMVALQMMSQARWPSPGTIASRWLIPPHARRQDFLQYALHWMEHKGLGAAFYKFSHKPHHRFTNPRLFDAFNGSVGDTVTMILIPLFITAQLLHANVWCVHTARAAGRPAEQRPSPPPLPQGVHDVRRELGRVARAHPLRDGASVGPALSQAR